MYNRSIIKRSLLFLVIFVLVTLAVAVSDSQPGRLGTNIVEAAPRQQTVPVVSFDRSTNEITEPNNTDTVDITINVVINVAPEDGKAAKVRYVTADGSAKAGVDYQAASGELTFPAGTTNVQSFKVTILGNNLNQPNRSFVVFLTNPVNATVGIPGSITITIVDNDAAPATSTPTSTPGGAVFIDKYEPNNNFETAYTTSANAAKLTGITLWPVGDEDYFQFFGKKGSTYEIYTTDLTSGLDTFLRVYDPDGNKIAENDDVDATNLRSQVQITAKDNGFYFGRVTNKNPANSTNETYSFGVNEILPPTPTSTATRVGQVDLCEPNNSLGQACLIGPGQVQGGMNFVPPEGTGTDNDFYVMPVKPGVLYTCETTNLSAPNDTNIIFLDNSGNDFNPPLGNDDRAVGDPSSLLSMLSTYQGNLYILVGPVNPPSYQDSPQFTYDLVCSSTAATPTPLPSPTTAFVAPPAGGGVIIPSATPFVFPTYPPTPTPIDLGSLAPTRVPPPIVGFQPLPTATPVAGSVQVTTVQLTVYYDSNFNFMPELNEGIINVAVELYDNRTGTLLAFGYTNEAGVVRFDSISSSGPVRVEVAYLNYSQVVVGSSSNILLRVEPRPLPPGIP